MLTIVIPAHNEEKLVIQTLIHLLSDGELTDCKIIFVCNGCIDNTVGHLRNYGEKNTLEFEKRSLHIEVIETKQASKTRALNIGLKCITTKTAVLLDADIKINGKDILNLVESLNVNKLLAAAPKVRFQYQKSSLLVRSYYRLSSQSFYNQYHRLSNVIALSSEGLKRIAKIPDIIADDEFIRRQFKLDEYKIFNTISFDLVCPKTLKDLLQVLTRVERGNLQLAKLNYLDNTGANLSGFIQKPLLSFSIFLSCKFFAKIRAKWQFANGNVSQWERDESNR